MKLQTSKPAPSSQRCFHRDTSGRQCRTHVLDPCSGLCPKHHAEQQHEQAADQFQHLTTKSQFFQTAQGINYSLMNLYQLLAQNRISPRRASVLAYINSLLLRTLPAIDADNAAGITDPAKQVPINVSVPERDADSDQDSDLDSDSDSDPDGETRAETETEAHADSTTSWDPSVPEPEPKKNPS